MRCYNGCWDSEATALFAQQDALMTNLREVEPNAQCTYFPVEGLFQVHDYGRPLSDFHQSRLAALEDACNRVQR